MKSTVRSSPGMMLGKAGDSGRKHFCDGTHRARDPIETLEWIAPRLTAMGITRVADITGLDRIGVPVTTVTRPNSRSLAVSQGKGLSLVSAQVSGIMESVETFHAERIDQPLRLTDESSLLNSDRVADIDRMPKSVESRYHSEQRLLWIQGWDLISGESLWVPYEAVHTDFTLPRPSGSGFFPANSNGLASGNLPVEAVEHALCEVIERDAVALWHLRRPEQRNVIALDSINDSNVLGLLEMLDTAKLDVRIWNSTCDTGVACFHCLLMEQENSQANPQFTDPEFGSGCHPDSRIALMRAITEAVQARTTFIAGSRDDFQPDDYDDDARKARTTACRQLLQQVVTEIPFSSVPCHEFDTLAQDVSWLLDQLTNIGITEVPCVDLSLTEYEIPVARVIVPGLEGASDGNPSDYVQGIRAKALSGS